MSRLDEFARLEPGWLGDGSGEAFSPEFLELVRSAVDRILEVSRADPPNLFPTPEGGVSAEWDLRESSVQLEMRPNTGGRLLLEGTCTSSGSDLEPTSDVDAAAAWLRAEVGR